VSRSGFARRFSPRLIPLVFTDTDHLHYMHLHHSSSSLWSAHRRTLIPVLAKTNWSNVTDATWRSLPHTSAQRASPTTLIPNIRSRILLFLLQDMFHSDRKRAERQHSPLACSSSSPRAFSLAIPHPPRAHRMSPHPVSPWRLRVTSPAQATPSSATHGCTSAVTANKVSPEPGQLGRRGGDCACEDLENTPKDVSVGLGGALWRRCRGGDTGADTNMPSDADDVECGAIQDGVSPQFSPSYIHTILLSI
jgi:hypothetical protein